GPARRGPSPPARAVAGGAGGAPQPGGSAARVDAPCCARRPLGPAPRRTVVVVFSDGLDSLSWLAADQVVEAAARSEALVYAVVARDKGDPENSFLREVTRATGGRLWTARS